MGFFRRQQEQLARRLIVWQYQRMNLPLPPTAELDRLSVELVANANQIARSTGKNMVGILKELIADLKRR